MKQECESMIKEQYVSFEVAKLLKEKGFKEETHGNYYLGGKFDGKFEESSKVNWNKFFKTPIAAPTQQMAMRWLREVQKLHIEINIISDFPEERYVVQIVKIKHCIPVLPIHSNYKYHVSEYTTYEDATEAAIKYCLENLVK